ncbi:MAG: glycosyltransferase, partial [Paracoccaceae bacterium]
MAWTVRRAVRERIAAGFDFDMIDAHYFYPDGVAAAMLGRWFRRPVVVTARGTDINVIAKLPRPGRMIARAAREAAAVIAVSRALGDELLHLGVPADRVHVLRNGVDLDRFRPANRAAARTDLGLAGEVLLVVGHLTGGKGHLTVLEALVRLPHATLVIAGDGPLRRALQARARSLGIKDRVRFCGAVPQGELPAYYNAASMLVLVSEREGMPNVVLEALACGTPVIATAVGGIPEIMTDPAAGIVLADGSVNALVDAVTRLLGRSPCAEAIRLHAEKFGWQPTTAAQLDLFTGILARS